MSFFEPKPYEPTRFELWMGRQLTTAFKKALATAHLYPVWTMMAPLKAAIDSDDAAAMADILKKCPKAARGAVDALEEVPLRYALQNEKYAAAKALLARDASLLLDRDYFGRQALADLAGPLTGDNDKTKRVLAFVIAAGAPVNDQGGEGKSALVAAVSRGSPAIADFLLGQGADINARDKWQQTPLSEAASYGCADIVKLFVERGADLNAASEHGYTPATSAVHGGYYDVALYLMQNGARVNFGAQNFDKPGDSADPVKDAAFLAALKEQKAEWDEAQRQAVTDAAVQEIETGIGKPMQVHALRLKGAPGKPQKRGFFFKKS